MFPAGFDEFYLDDSYTARANSGTSETSEIYGESFQQISWSLTHGGATDDIGFGSAADPGPVVSFASQGVIVNCES